MNNPSRNCGLLCLLAVWVNILLGCKEDWHYWTNRASLLLWLRLRFSRHGSSVRFCIHFGQWTSWDVVLGSSHCYFPSMCLCGDVASGEENSFWWHCYEEYVNDVNRPIMFLRFIYASSILIKHKEIISCFISANILYFVTLTPMLKYVSYICLLNTY